MSECFADDSMFFTVGRTAEEAVKNFNEVSKDVADWVSEAFLELSGEEKCLSMIVSSQYSKNRNTDITNAVQLGVHTLQELA